MAFDSPEPAVDIRGSRALAAIPYLALLAVVYTIFPITTDDSYITLRYAQNLLTGHGPVFNTGVHVEGYSSPLHLLLLAVLLKVLPGLDPLFMTKLASLVFGLLALWFTGGFARRAGLGRGETIVAQTLLALNINFALASVNGLETTLYAVLVLACVSRFLDERERGSGIGSAWLALLMLLTRPDAMLLVACLGLIRLADARRQQTLAIYWAGWVGGILAGAAIFLAWRYAFYGSLLPNTYYAKQIPLSGSLPLGLRYFLRGVSSKTLILSSIRLMPILYLCIAAFWALCIAGLVNQRRQPAGLIVSALLVASVVFMLRSGGDWMLGWRFMIPMLPLICVMQLFGWRALAGSLRKPAVKARAYALVLAIPLLALLNAPHLAWSSVGFATDGRTLLQAHGGDEEGHNGRLWVAVGDYIQANAHPGAKIVYSEMGYAGYANLDKTFLDLRGLTDRDVARSPSSHRTIEGIQDSDWYLPVSPIYWIVTSFNPDLILSPTPTHSSEILGGYRLTGSVESVEIYAR